MEKSLFREYPCRAFFGKPAAFVFILKPGHLSIKNLV